MNNKLEVMLQASDHKINAQRKMMFLLGICAGFYIGIGCILYGLVTNLQGPANLLRLIGAFLFTIGLNLVVFKKAQLFTGNILMAINLIKKRTSAQNVFINWIVVFIGNLIGSLILASITHYIFIQSNSLPIHLSKLASIKTNYSFFTAIVKATYCNILVCLAIWFAVTQKTVIRKVIGIIIPITAFVYLGFEHSIANMFFIPLGLSFKELSLNQGIFLFIKNIFPVTLGNILGGVILSLVLVARAKLFPRIMKT